MLFKKKINPNYLQERAPVVMFWVASIALVFFEARVLDVMYTLTHSYLLTVGALFATGAMFFVWKIAFQYALANQVQVNLASVGMALSLLASAVFGGMDFFVRGGLKIDAGAEKFDAVDLLFWGVPVLSVIHVVMALYFWYADPVLTMQRKTREAEDDSKFAENSMDRANTLLERRMVLTARFAEATRLYGKNAAVKMLEELGIDPSQFDDLDIRKGDSKEIPEIPASTPPQTVPAPIPAKSNGNGNGHGGLMAPVPSANGNGSNFPSAV